MIEATLASLRESQGVDLTIWIIDQSDGEETARVVAAHAGEDRRVRYIRTNTRGISAARNLGVRASSAPLILFTDDDCLVDQHWAAELAAELTSADHWAAFGRIVGVFDEQPERPQVSPGIMLATQLCPTRTVFAGNRFNLSFGHGASMGVRREAVTRLGGFDEALGTGGPLRSWEDRDFGYRVLSAGGRIIYTPRALLFHRQWRSWPGVRRTYAEYGIGAGAAAGKYLRCGDPGGIVLLVDWLFHAGLRPIVSGVIRWRSWQKVTVGLLQLVFTWKGLASGLQFRVDRLSRLYQVSAPQHASEVTPPRSLTPP